MVFLTICWSRRTFFFCFQTFKHQLEDGTKWRAWGARPKKTPAWGVSRIKNTGNDFRPPVDEVVSVLTFLRFRWRISLDFHHRRLRGVSTMDSGAGLESIPLEAWFLAKPWTLLR